MENSDRLTAAPRLLIAGSNSGCGKTTVACAMLQALKERGIAPAAFKCGPDYIDPMFHTEVLGVPSMNLDLFFSSPEELRTLFAAHAREANVIEGVMGFYDGMDMGSPQASAWDLAGALDAPAVLVVNARGMALSAAGIVKGFMTLREPNRVCGVILNRITAMTYPRLKAVIEQECGIPVYGWLPADEEYSLESRYLGLVTAGEIENLQEKLRILGRKAAETLDLDGLLALMHTASALEKPAPAVPVNPRKKVRIAVARDRAFCFYYQANRELLEHFGAELVPFSPMTDSCLPECDGLMLGGGYPELCVEQLSANVAMRKSIRSAVENGLPTVAECGGFMYLCDSIAGHPMAGVIHTDCENKGKLGRFGYITVKAEQDSLLFAAGDEIRAHEYHYWDTPVPGDALNAIKPAGRSWRCGYVTDTLYAGYPHLYFPSCPSAAERFVRKCLERSKNAWNM